jgi:DNA-binding protein HU-beta
MNKKDLIRSIAESAQVSRTTAERGLNGLLAALESAMKEGQRVTVVGFGSFSVVERAPRTGRNPKTGEMVPIPSRRVVRFRPGKELAEKIE